MPGLRGSESIRDRAPDTGTPSSGIDEPAESRILVAGAGNWLLASDRIGPRVLEMVSERYPSGVELCDIGSTALSLLDSLRGQDLLIVIDACVGRGTPHTVWSSGQCADMTCNTDANSVHGVPNVTLTDANPVDITIKLNTGQSLQNYSDDGQCTQP